MECGDLLNTGFLQGLFEGRTDGELTDGQSGISSREEPRAFGLVLPVVIAQHFQESGAQHGLPVLVSLAGMHMDAHSLAVDVGLLEAGHLGQTQTGSLTQSDEGFVLHESGCFVDGQYLLSAQHDRNPLGQLGGEQVLDNFRLLEDVSVEELEGRDVRFLHVWTGALFCAKVDKEAFDFLSAHVLRGTHEVLGEVSAAVQIGLVGFGTEPPSQAFGFHLVVKISHVVLLFCCGFLGTCFHTEDRMN